MIYRLTLVCHVLLGILEKEGGMIYLQLQFEFWLKESQLIILKEYLAKQTLRFFGTVESIVSWCIVRNTLLKDIVVIIRARNTHQKRSACLARRCSYFTCL